MRQHRVLVVDHDPNFLERTAAILAGAGIGMIPAASGDQVLALCSRGQSDAVLLDGDLAGISRRIKRQLDPTLPVVLMFRGERPSLDQLTTRCLADNYLVRPIKRTELLFCMRSLLELRGLLQEMPPATIRAKGRGHVTMLSLHVFCELLRLEIQRVQRHGYPLAALAIRMDPLAGQGGAWGRSLDLQLAPTVAETIRGALRGADLSTVVSPSELLVLMPHTDGAGARTAAERICRTVGAQSYHFGRTRIHPTVSIGVACLEGQAGSAGELLERAETNRASATASGGNLVVGGQGTRLSNVGRARTGGSSGPVFLDDHLRRGER
jgi:diguanylate cyclase (GGDEF)-like protein